MTLNITGRHLRGVAFVVLCLACLYASGAWGHDWYTGTENSRGQLCCGGQDCHMLADSDVKEVAGGYQVKGYARPVPYGELQPSPDGKWHMCFWGGEIKCFFGPLPGF